MGNIENKRTCVVCGRKYKACRNCEENKSRGIFSWRASCDTPECFSVMLILSDYYYKYITKDEAKEKLTEYLSQDMLPYTENTKNLIDEIFLEAQDVNEKESTITENTENNSIAESESISLIDCESYKNTIDNDDYIISPKEQPIECED